MRRRKHNTSSKLRQRLTLQQEMRTSDEAGGYTRSWIDIADLWAEIIPMRGSEKVFGNQVQAAVTHKIKLRYREDVKPEMRLQYDNRVFNIRHVINISEMNEVLEVLAEEGVAA